MNYSLAQIILVAQSRDPGSWMNILVLVLVAAVYGLATILKAKKGKKEQEQEQVDEQQIRKPQRKPEGGMGLLEQFVREIQHAVDPTQERESRPADQPAPKKIAHPQPTVRKYADEAKQAGRVQPRTPPAKPKRPGLELSIPAPQVQPDFEEFPELQTGIEALPEYTSKTVEGLVGKRKVMAEFPKSKYLSEVLLDYADPDELRMAILHYEILGRPLSLRDPSGQIIGL
ncbi:hypothetical protein ES703_68549 [subsurface metagenome]